MKVVQKKATIENIQEIDSAKLLTMLHEAKRQRQGNKAEEIQQEFTRRDRIKVNASLRRHV